ncbi:MAG: phosphonopyruvate decarboxylase [Mailhella sp.]|nr:phosphonopyruvate decarboxylase [Mailhella sp.]
MQAERFAAILGADFYTGVPDSLLKGLSGHLFGTWGTDPKHHVIAPNEGSCAAVAAGYHLATGKVPVVYLQNSGEGNIVNPLASLLSDAVYGIPVLFVVGWRGEPGVPDEPQHAFQGQVTLRLLEDMDVAAFVLGPDTAEDELTAVMEGFRGRFAAGKSAAIVVRKGALTHAGKITFANGHSLGREEALRHVVAASGEDPVVCTTGKAGRELFELREAAGQGHHRDFLTVGSMGHCCSIALGIAVHAPQRRVWCVDGDGAFLMHMGAAALIASARPRNLIHVVINNEAHESVGSMPTAAPGLDIAAVARVCGYPSAVTVRTADELDAALAEAKAKSDLCLIEIKCALGARADLGRPTIPPKENKKRFMEWLRMSEE